MSKRSIVYIDLFTFLIVLTVMNSLMSCRNEGQGDAFVPLVKNQQFSRIVRDSVVLDVAKAEMISSSRLSDTDIILVYRIRHKLAKQLIQGSDFKKIQHLSQNVKNDFFLRFSNGEKLKCAGVVFESSGNIDPGVRLVLHFNNVSLEPDALIYTDRLFGLGRVVHSFDSSRPILK